MHKMMVLQRDKAIFIASLFIYSLALVLLAIYTRTATQKINTTYIETGIEVPKVDDFMIKIAAEESDKPEIKRFSRKGTTFKRNKSAVFLPGDVINGIKKFVFFIGYPRSGHSIVGSIMDAHPHMIIAHEFMLFSKIDTGSATILHSKVSLLNNLYRDSYEDSVHGWRNEGYSEEKGYTLDIDNSWQGRYDRYVDVIGDKSGGITTFLFMRSNSKFKNYYNKLLTTVRVPIRVIHVVRNPYDMISTSDVYATYGSDFLKEVKNNTSTKIHSKLDRASKKLDGAIERAFKMVRAVTKMKKIIGEENVLDIHGSDLVHDPKGTIRSICDFLGVESPEDYLQACEDKVYKNVSRTRELLPWSLEMIKLVATKMKDYQFLSRYSWESD